MGIHQLLTIQAGWNIHHRSVTMPSVPVSLLLLLLAAQTSTAAGEPRRLLSSLLSLLFPATLQLLRLERIRELKQTILEREEEENRNLEEMIKSVEMEKTEEAKIGQVPMVPKRNPICLRRCLRAGILHPAQCYVLC